LSAFLPSFPSWAVSCIWQVPGAAGKKKKKQGDKKFGGLESGRADPGRRVSSTRYTSAPCKDDPKSNYAPMKSGKGAAAEADKNVDELQMPVVAENDYLLPQSGAAAAAPYMDIVPDSGISSSVFLCVMLYCYCYYWFRGTVVEHRSLTGELALSCTRPTADG